MTPLRHPLHELLDHYRSCREPGTKVLELFAAIVSRRCARDVRRLLSRPGLRGQQSRPRPDAAHPRLELSTFCEFCMRRG